MLPWLNHKRSCWQSDVSCKKIQLIIELASTQELQQAGAPELESTFTASDVERALWSTAASTMPQKTPKRINPRKSKAADTVEESPLTTGKKRQKRS